MAGVRTVSQLPRLERGNIQDNSLFYVSQLSSNGDYFPNSYALSTMYGDLSGKLSTDLNNLIHFRTPSGQLVNLQQMSSDYYGSQHKIVVDGAWTQIGVDKTLKFYADKRPYVEVAQNQFSNLATMRDLSGAGAVLGADLSWENPLDQNGYAKQGSPNQEFKFTDGDNPLYEGWNSLRMTNEVVTGKTGYATIWGWIADDGNVSPENAWVGLFMKKGGSYLPVQFQPWIVGKYSQQLQYVGFNAPVKKDQTLVIKTGFKVNLNTRGGFQGYGSITYTQFEPCTFVMNIAGTN